MEATEIIGKIEEAVRLASAPAALSVVSSIALTQAIKAFDHVLWRHMKPKEVWALAWLGNIPLFYLWCKGLDIPFRGENFALAVISGVASPILVALLKRIGIDLDKWFGGDDDETPTPPKP